MCYTSVIYNKNQPIGAKGYWVLANMISQNYESNNDGYALRYDDVIIRTLNIKEFLKAVADQKTAIENSKIAHLHLRKATNAVNQDFIHLWTKGNYFCSHNGVLNNTTEKKKNDSLEFFKTVAQFVAEDNIKQIKRTIEKSENFGYGVFFCTHKDQQKIIMFSYGKSIKLYKLDEMYVFSCDALDFEQFEEELMLETGVKSKKWYGFEFKDAQKITIKSERPEVKNFLASEQEGFIMLMNGTKSAQMLKIKTKSCTYGFDLSQYSGYSGYDYGQFGAEHPQAPEQEKISPYVDKFCLICKKMLTEDEMLDPNLMEKYCSENCMLAGEYRNEVADPTEKNEMEDV